MKKILLVDDTREIYQLVVHSVGEIADVTWAKCLEDASTLLAEREFNLLILDIELPDGNGIEFCSRIKPIHPNVPVLFITSHTTLAEKKEAFIVGAEGFITKPFTPSALCERVEEVGNEDAFNDLLEFYLVG